MEDKFQNPFKSVQLDEYNRYVAGALGAGFGAISGIAHSAALPNHGAELIIPAHITAWSSYFYGKGLKDDIDSAYYRHQKNLQVYGPNHPETQKTKNELKDLSKKIVFFPHILGNLYHRAVSGKWTASGQDYLRELKKKEKEALAENTSTGESADLPKDSIIKSKLRYIIPGPAALLARSAVNQTGKGSTIPFEVSNTPYESKLPVYRG